MTAATYDDSAATWAVDTDRGDHVVCRFLVAATGCLSAPLEPDIAGLHSFAGDTLCCATMVTEKFDFGDAPVGGLRLRMIGAKNIDSSTGIAFTAPGTGHPPSTVLDLDFTVAIPKRTNH